MLSYALIAAVVIAGLVYAAWQFFFKPLRERPYFPASGDDLVPPYEHTHPYDEFFELFEGTTDEALQRQAGGLFGDPQSSELWTHCNVRAIVVIWKAPRRDAAYRFVADREQRSIWQIEEPLKDPIEQVRTTALNGMTTAHTEIVDFLVSAFLRAPFRRYINKGE